MQLTLRRDSQGQVIRFLLVEERNGSAQTGLTAQSEGLIVVYVREGDSSPTVVEPVLWAGDSYVSGGFREIDAQTMPGLYEFGLPDDVCRKGANRATLMVQARGVSAQVIDLDLVGYDPYDSYNLGLDCLTREGRHQVISGAFREVVPEIVEEFLRKS